MISEIAYRLAKTISESVPFIDKWAGLVMPMKKMVNKVEKVIPVFVNTKDVCNISDYKDLIPDSTKRSLLYIEKISDVSLEYMNRATWLATCDLRIVLWYNLNLIHAGEFLDEGVLAYNILSKIPKSLHNNLFVYCQNVRLYPSGTDSGADLFSAYTYDEVRTQFVTFPYGAIAINVNVQYTINNCAAWLTPESACGFPDYVAPPVDESVTVDAMIITVDNELITSDTI